MIFSKAELAEEPATFFVVPLEENDSSYGRGQLGMSLLFLNESTLNLVYNTTIGLSSITYGYWSLGYRVGL